MNTTTRQPTVLTIGGATYDLFVRTGKDVVKVDANTQAILLPIGHKIRVQEVVETCGGGATNTAVGLKRLGCATSFCGIVGSDQWGDRILANLKKEGVDISPATIVDGEMSSFSIILNTETGERVILYATGANAHLHDATFDKESAATSDWIVFNHIHEKSCIIQDDIVEVLKNANRKMGMTWNPGGRQLTQGMDAADNAALLKYTTLLLLNKEEAIAFSGKKTVPAAIKALLKAGAMSVCVTDGKHGCTASDGRMMYHCPTIADVKIIDTTGAGDAFGTGATWALLRGADLQTALKAGTINATSVLATTGAQAGLLTDIEIQKRLNETRLTVDERAL